MKNWKRWWGTRWWVRRDMRRWIGFIDFTPRAWKSAARVQHRSL